MFNNKGRYWGRGDRRLAPFRIPGLIGWWSDSFSRLAENSDGSTPATIATQPVGYEANLVGDGSLNATQTVDARRPTLTEVSGGLVSVYDGIDNNQVIPGDALLMTPPLTVFMKFEFSVLPSVHGAFEWVLTYLDADTNNNPWVFLLRFDTDKMEVQFNDSDSTQTKLVSLAALTINTPYLAMFTIDASFNVEFFLNNVSQATATLAKALYPGDGDLIAGALSSAGASPYKGALIERGAYAGALNSYERDLLQGFFI